MKNLRSVQRIWLALVVLVVLALAGAGVVDAQVRQPAEWITAKRLTVATQADIGTALTAAPPFAASPMPCSRNWNSAPSAIAFRR